MDEKLPHNRAFAVWLTIFGSMFTTGLFIVFQSFSWGIFYIVAGLIGLAVLIRDRISKTISKTSLRMPLLILACAVVSVFVGHTISMIEATQEAVSIYVLPRHVSEEQAGALRNLLSHTQSHHVAVKVNSTDEEATEYAAELVNALGGGGWDAELDTSSGGPFTGNSGLCIAEEGAGAKDNDPKNIPFQNLRDALRNANILADCSSSSPAGENKIYLTVGHRPFEMGVKLPIKQRLAEWLLSLGH